MQKALAAGTVRRVLQLIMRSKFVGQQAIPSKRLFLTFPPPSRRPCVQDRLPPAPARLQISSRLHGGGGGSGGGNTGLPTPRHDRVDESRVLREQVCTELEEGDGEDHVGEHEEEGKRGVGGVGRRGARELGFVGGKDAEHHEEELGHHGGGP